MKKLLTGATSRAYAKLPQGVTFEGAE
jgi:hypothetical protein